MKQGRSIVRRGFLAGIAAVAIAGPTFAQDVDINGLYIAEGRNPDGSAYTGQASIVEQDGKVEVHWILGPTQYKGTGIRQGQVVMVNYGADSPAVYVVMSNGDLHGTWDNGTALERLVRQ